MQRGQAGRSRLTGPCGPEREFNIEGAALFLTLADLVQNLNMATMKNTCTHLTFLIINKMLEKTSPKKQHVQRVLVEKRCLDLMSER